jgi:hypothetical protein
MREHIEEKKNVIIGDLRRLFVMISSISQNNV